MTKDFFGEEIEDGFYLNLKDLQVYFLSCRQNYIAFDNYNLQTMVSKNQGPNHLKPKIPFIKIENPQSFLDQSQKNQEFIRKKIRSDLESKLALIK